MINLVYPEHMKREAREIIAATRAAGIAIQKFIERSPKHLACYEEELREQRIHRERNAERQLAVSSRTRKQK